MTGPVAQIVALTCYGNAFLRGHTVPGFFPTNSTCQFCGSVTFVEAVKPLLGKQKEIEIAKNPDERFFSSSKEMHAASGSRVKRRTIRSFRTG